MKRTKLLIVIATVLMVSLLLGSQERPEQWEYARLSYGMYTNWYWSEPDVSVEGEDVAELCKKLSIETPQIENNVFVIFDWAGSQGWELATLTRHPEYSVGWFKRPKQITEQIEFLQMVFCLNKWMEE